MPSIFDALPEAPAASQAAAPASGSIFDALPGDTSAAPSTGSSLARNAKAFGQGALSTVADAVDLAYDFLSAPLGAGAMAGSLLTRGVSELEGRTPRDRKASAAQALEAADAVSSTIGQPVRKALQALGLLPEEPGLIGKSMSRAMEIAGQAAANIETNTDGAVKKEEVLMGVNALFAALGVKGAKAIETSAVARGKAKAGLEELAKLKAEGDARNAAADAAALAKEAAGAPTEPAAPPAQGMQAKPADIFSDLPAFDKRVAAEKQAYDLMQSGASKAKVDAIVAKNPAVGEALSAIRARREQASRFLEEAPAEPIREDGSFAPGALTSLLHRPSEMGPAELAARDAAAGIRRGPLGEPILADTTGALNRLGVASRARVAGKIIGVTGSAGKTGTKEALAAALARGNLRTIGATTWAEYKKYFEKDAALARRFQVVKVEEPSEELACAMLRGMAPLMERHGYLTTRADPEDGHRDFLERLGLAKGGLTEVVGALSGAGLLIAGLLERESAFPEMTALVDGCDAFDPWSVPPAARTPALTCSASARR